MASKKGLAPTTTSPAKMGEEMAHAQANASESTNVEYRPRGGSKNGAPVGTKTPGPRRVNVQERLGAQYAPQMTMSSPQAPEASLTQRNVRIVNSAIGNRDFFLKRQYGQNFQ